MKKKEVQEQNGWSIGWGTEVECSLCDVGNIPLTLNLYRRAGSLLNAEQLEDFSGLVSLGQWVLIKFVSFVVRCIKDWRNMLGKNLISLWVWVGRYFYFWEECTGPMGNVYDILSSALSHSGSINVSCSNGISKSTCRNPIQRSFWCHKYNTHKATLSIANVSEMLLLNSVLCGLKSSLLRSSFIGWMVKHDVKHYYG